MELTLFTKYQNIRPTKGATSKRASIIEEFVTEINKERPCTYKVNGVKKKLGKVTPRAIAIKLSHIKSEHDLTYFLSVCRSESKRGSSFSRCFFGSLKTCG